MSEFQTLLENATARHKVVGASAALFHEGELKLAAVGAANSVADIPLTRDTVMLIGSITKVFTATLIMQLVDEKCVALEDLVLKHVPHLQLADKEALEAITVKMLLNHTSGIDGEMWPEQGHDDETIEKGIERFAALGQLFPPGTASSYCNAAVTIAGYLAQVVTGTSWYDLIKERIFKPLDMRHAAALPEDVVLHRASVGHFLDPKTGAHRRTSFAYLPFSFAPGGTTLSMSASDLITFARAHLNDGVGPNGTRILSAESAQLMRQQTVAQLGASHAGVGLGWMTLGGDVVGHGGGGPGIAAWMMADPAREFAATVLTNSEHGSALIKELMGHWFRDASNLDVFPAPNVPGPAQTIDHPSRYVGSYEDISLDHIIAETADGLTISVRSKFAYYDSVSTEPIAPMPLQRIDGERFYFEPTEEQRESNPDAFGGAGKMFIEFRDFNDEGSPTLLATGYRCYRRRPRSGRSII